VPAPQHTPFEQKLETQSPLTLQPLPATHRTQPPPQSTSVSAASLTPSLQPAAGRQALLVQLPLAQSVGKTHICPAAQPGQLPPPQSTSVSALSRLPSLHGDVAQRPPLQFLLAQSKEKLQRFPIAQVGQLPPQSTSLSSPFSIPSEQEGAAHWLFAHTALAQSRGKTHALPTAQPGQSPPPQSTSLSLCCFTPSLQCAGGPRSGALASNSVESELKS
jgi:hypothetical protein